MCALAPLFRKTPMHRFRVLPAALLFLLAPACVTYHEQLYVGSESYEVASRETPGGGKETFRLDLRANSGEGSLRVDSEYDRERPFLGLKLIEIDKREAEKRHVDPYCGMLVTGAYPRSAAEAAGVVPGDLLLELDGRKTIYLAQVAEIESTLLADREVVAKVKRGEQTLDLSLRAKVLKERVSGSESVALESCPTHRPYAGVTVRGIPAVWCEKIYGQPRNAVVVTNVEVGSPAWLAGVRAGDVIDEVDGRPVPTVVELADQIARRGPAGDSMRWRVSRGREGAYEGVVELADYSGETNLWVPLVVDVQNGVYEDKWSLGPFGLLMGNRNSYIADSGTRSVEKRNVFHMLLGLLRVETTPRETDVRLLWFIHFDT